MSKQMAIMQKVGFGCRDVGTPILYYDVYISECHAALNTMGPDEAVKFIKAYGVYDVHDLNGKPVWVEASDGLIKTIEPCVV